MGATIGFFRNADGRPVRFREALGPLKPLYGSVT